MRSSLKKIRFVLSVGTSTIFVALLGIYAFRPTVFIDTEASPANAIRTTTYVPKPKIKTTIVTVGTPSRLIIPKLELDLPIAEGKYDAGSKEWSFNSDYANFALPSVLANDYEGNTLIYGHNYAWAFGRLSELGPGDTMTITTSNGHEFGYVYQKNKAVAPDDLSVFRYDGPPTLTLQTCGGYWNEQRHLYEFDFKELAK